MEAVKTTFMEAESEVDVVKTKSMEADAEAEALPLSFNSYFLTSTEYWDFTFFWGSFVKLLPIFG